MAAHQLKVDSEGTPLWASICFKISLHTASHPFEYAKVLIQIGHEPLAPYPTKSLFGKPVFGLPNVITYVRYIKSVDGFIGCYRGLLPRLICNSINFATYKKVTKHTLDRSSDYVAYIKKKEEQYTESDRYEKFLHETVIEICGKITAVVASQPFYVITIRTMAQFVGGETKYDGIISSISEIYKDEGILGFFRGLIPKLCAEILFTIFVSVCAFTTKRLLDDKDELRKICGLPISIVGTTLTYPFHVVSSCMAVNNSGLISGEPPQMPIYSSWIECWNHLSRTHQLNRGSAMFFRSYTGPYLSRSHHTLLLKK